MRNAAISDGGAVCLYYSNPAILNCTIAENVAAYYGGGTYCYSSDPTITNCTITGNSAGSQGGGLWLRDSDPTLTNCILWGDVPGELYVHSGSPAVTHSDVQGGWAGEGNIDADPLFVVVGPQNDDYHLSADSPCIDAGDNDALPADTLDLDGDGDTTEPIPIDLDCRLRCADRVETPDTGNPDPNYPHLPIVDMGAYEHQCDGDLDGDGDIDLTDLAQLLANFGTTMTVYADGDIDLDGDVDLTDLAALLAVYGTTCE